MDLMYLDNLEEFINDEKRIVTYRWLSLTLNVSSNIAKQMLFHYYDKNKNFTGDSKLSVTYLLSGIKFDDNLKQDIHKVCVVRDEEFEKVKSTFKQIYSLHIYSIQKSKLKDLHILYATDYDKIKENVEQSVKYSFINFSTAKIKEQATKEVIQEESIKKGVPEKDFASIKKTEESPENKENKANIENVKAQLPSKKIVAKGSLQSMFANQAKKLESKKTLEIKGELNSKSKSGSSLVSKKNPLSAFITKGQLNSNKPQQKTDPIVKVESSEDTFSEEIKVVNSKTKSTEDVCVKEENEKSSTKADKKERVQKNSSKASKSNKVAPKGKRKSSENLSSSKTKRQRIRFLNSSSESSSEEEEKGLMDECPFPSPVKAIESDDDEILLPTPESREEKEVKLNKRRKRKQVDKTFLNEEGYLVTMKEFEMVSDSDQEENPIPPPKSPKLLPPKANKSPKKSPVKRAKKSPVKTKQPTLMNFFKKKT